MISHFDCKCCMLYFQTNAIWRADEKVYLWVSVLMMSWNIISSNSDIVKHKKMVDKKLRPYNFQPTIYNVDYWLVVVIYFLKENKRNQRSRTHYRSFTLWGHNWMLFQVTVCNFSLLTGFFVSWHILSDTPLTLLDVQI